MRVILAQESRTVRNCLRAALRSTRYAQSPAVDAENGGDLLRSLRNDVDADTLVLLDWNLPALDVPTLLGYLRQCGTLDRVSILLCVNAAQAPLAAHAVGLGARGVIVRPFSDETLSAKIEEIGRARPAAGPLDASTVLRNILTNVRMHEELPALLGLPSDLIARLFEKTSKAHYEPGTLVLGPGGPVDGLSFVTQGEVEIVSSDGTGGRLTRGVGECFAERAFICGEPSRVSVRALTAVDVVTVPKESVVELARRHPALQNFFTVLLTRGSAPSASGGDSELSGTIASLPFPDLLQFLNSTRKTGVLILKVGRSLGKIYFERGEVTDARENGEAGEAVFFRLAGWQEAQFDFKAGSSSRTRTMFQSTMNLLVASFRATQAQESSDSTTDPAHLAQVG